MQTSELLRLATLVNRLEAGAVDANEAIDLLGKARKSNLFNDELARQAADFVRAHLVAERARDTVRQERGTF